MYVFNFFLLALCASLPNIGLTFKSVPEGLGVVFA